MLKMVPHRVVIPFLLSIFIFESASTAAANDSKDCKQYCGDNKTSQKRVQYPFGFSDGCKIRLNCSDTTGDFKIGNLAVYNVSADHIFVNLPGKCNRSIKEIEQLTSKNYAITSRNTILLQECSSAIKDCSINLSMLEAFDGCSSTSSNISCHSKSSKKVDFMSYDELKRTNCSYVFSSITFDIDTSVKRIPAAFSLEFQKVELDWWLEGNCSCDGNAKCRSFKTPNQRPGYRCYCKEGFVGDGFNGTGHRGCQKVSDCNALKFISARCKGKRKIAVFIGGIFAGACLLAILALICCFIRKQSKFLKNQMSAKRLLCEAVGGSCVPIFPYKEIERATNTFSDKQRLGTGAYGTVYAGKLHNGKWVAIKKIRHRDTDSIEQVMNEIKLLSSVSHPNLVRLLGCCIENGEQILVYEYMPNGTLSQHLQREGGKGLPWTIRLTIATETAHAISHLHTAINPPIYHRDIKSSNILLDYNFNSKVADFGLSRFGMTDDSHISTAPQGTPGYVDPQYHQNFHLSDKSDVYSLGVVLVEIMTALKVVDFSRPHSEINLAALAIDRIGKGRVDEIIDPFLEPHRDAWTLSSIHKVAELAFRCLAFHRDMRPSMVEVADELEQIRLSGWAPLEETICMMSSVSSSCSSPYDGSDKFIGGTMSRRTAGGSWSVIVPQKVADCLIPEEEVKDSSPVSVQDPWLSEESSPSSNSLLGNAVR